MWGIAVILMLIGIIAFFVYLAKNLPKEYMPITIFLWACIPLLINVGLFFIYKIVQADFSSSLATAFESLLVVGLGVMTFIYFYLLGTGVVKLVNDFKEKRYIERLTKT